MLCPYDFKWEDLHTNVPYLYAVYVNKHIPMCFMCVYLPILFNRIRISRILRKIEHSYKCAQVCKFENHPARILTIKDKNAM